MATTSIEAFDAVLKDYYPHSLQEILYQRREPTEQTMRFLLGTMLLTGAVIASRRIPMTRRALVLGGGAAAVVGAVAS